MLSLMTGRYPFFIASDDMNALYEIRCIFGREAMQAAGLQLGACSALVASTLTLDPQLIAMVQCPLGSGPS